MLSDTASMATEATFDHAANDAPAAKPPLSCEPARLPAPVKLAASISPLMALARPPTTLGTMLSVASPIIAIAYASSRLDLRRILTALLRLCSLASRMSTSAGLVTRGGSGTSSFFIASAQVSQYSASTTSAASVLRSLHERRGSVTAT